MVVPKLDGWLGPNQKWLAGTKALSKVAAKIKKWLHTCVQRVGVSQTLTTWFLRLVTTYIYAKLWKFEFLWKDTVMLRMSNSKSGYI